VVTLESGDAVMEVAEGNVSKEYFATRTSFFFLLSKSMIIPLCFSQYWKVTLTSFRINIMINCIPLF
jgi:hypothetical protein